MFEDLLAGFDARRREYRAQETDRLNREADREFSILRAMAEHPDPEIASLGTAGILEIAGGVRPAKGLRTWFGEMERSSFYPQLRQALLQPSGQGQGAAQPGSAALPGSSPIEPGRQAQGPLVGSAPPTGGTVRDLRARAADVGAPPTFGPAGRAGAGGGVQRVATGAAGAEASSAPPGMDRIEGGPPAAPPGYREPLQAGGWLGQMSEDAPPELGQGPLAGPPPPPPQPESPAQRYRRLFPTAAEVAGAQTYEQLKARLRAAFDSLTPEDLASDPYLRTDLVRGALGTPRRATRAQAFNAEYVDASGQRGSGAVSFDPETRQAFGPDDQPVQVLRRLPTAPPAPIRGDLMQGPDGRLTRPWFTRDMQNIVATQEGVVSPTQVPAPVRGNPIPMTGPDGQVRMYWPTREGGLIEAVGFTPPPPTGKVQDPEAVGLLAAVDREIKALETPQFPGMPRRPVTAAAADEIVKRLSKGRWQSLAELRGATVPQPGARSSGPPDLSSLAGQVERRLRQGRPDIVSGSGMPPPGP